MRVQRQRRRRDRDDPAAIAQPARSLDEAEEGAAQVDRHLPVKMSLVRFGEGGRLEDAVSAPVAIVAYSPWVDPSLEGESVVTRGDVDPILNRQSLSRGAEQYLAGADVSDPRVNALKADFAKLSPVRIDVGDDEILLDDSLRFEALAGEAGRQVETHVWKGMVHVFPTNVAMLKASARALDGTAEFLKRHF